MHVCLVTSDANDFSLFKSKTFAEFCFTDFFFLIFEDQVLFSIQKIKTRKISMPQAGAYTFLVFFVSKPSFCALLLISGRWID